MTRDETMRLEQLAALLDLYRAARSYTGDPAYTTVEGRRVRL